MFAAKRLGKELTKIGAGSTTLAHLVRQIKEQLPPGIELVDAPDFLEWKVDIRVLDTNPLYKDQTYRLRLRFNNKYPIEPPEVIFFAESKPPRPIPMHPHIYTNGIICLDLLGNGWSPVQNVESICVSLQSMLTGNTKNERPPGDEEFCRRTKLPGQGNIRTMNFVYEDDKV